MIFYINPFFDLSAPRYDTSTFAGRLRHFLQITDVRTLFTTDKKLKDALKTIENYNKSGRPILTDPNEINKLWNAKKIRDAIIHPDTGEKIFLPFRLSCFVPINVVIAAGMLVPNPSMFSVIFWQWINQSYNIALNHANRNASNQLSTEKIAKTYALAVSISCGVAVGLGQFVKRVSFNPITKATLKKFVPFTAVATAGLVNVFMMRWNEIKEGIDVKDHNEDVIGKSKKAGLSAVSQVAISRIATALPVLTFPPIIMGFLEKTSILKSNPRLRAPIDLLVITTCLWTALPVAIAIFPQQVAVESKNLEEYFHNLKDKNGKQISTIYYNRGL